jgi:predicted Fe-S protein YdhL (DUF1289 family)
MSKEFPEITKSPCIELGTCGTDIYGNYCTSCGRTVEEIMEWPSASQARKKEIVKGSKERKHENGKN